MCFETVHTAATVVAASGEDRAPAGLRLNQALQRALYECSPAGILLTERDGRILAANPAACRMLGRTEEQLRTLVRLDLVQPGDPRLPALQAERERSGHYQGELTLVRGDGSAFEAEVTSVVASGEDATIISMIIRDVTERKRAEARVREQAQWLDIANEAILATDLGHRVTYWSKGAERMSGWCAAEVVGRRLDDLMSRAGISDRQVCAAAMQMADWRGTLACRHANGTPLVLAASATMVRDGNGQPTGRLCICTDISEQTLLKEKYERVLRLQSIGMLAAGVAHDFNNILTPIQISAQLLRERVSHREDVELLDTVQACVTRGAAVTRHILDFARGVGSEARPIQVGPILREVREIIRETFPRAIVLEVDTPADLWPVMANPTQIHQLLLNLCVNARDAMPQGGRLRLAGRNCVLDDEAAARLEGARKGPWLVLCIEDTGTGIPPELLPRIWEPFFTTKPGQQGTGLGLATVRDIVETHAGFVAIDTRAGLGTTFRVFLPALGSVHPPSEPGAPARVSAGNGEAILVVEDERGVREVIAAALAHEGYRVATAADGAEALALIAARPERFDLVLTDIDMPKVNGAKLAAALAAMRPAPPVAAMSGVSSRADGLDLAQFAGGFLPKPFTVDELLQAVRQAIRPAAPARLNGHHGIPALPGTPPPAAHHPIYEPHPTLT